MTDLTEKDLTQQDGNSVLVDKKRMEASTDKIASDIQEAASKQGADMEEVSNLAQAGQTQTSLKNIEDRNSNLGANTEENLTSRIKNSTGNHLDSKPDDQPKTIESDQEKKQSLIKDILDDPRLQSVDRDKLLEKLKNMTISELEKANDNPDNIQIDKAEELPKVTTTESENSEVYDLATSIAVREVTNILGKAIEKVLDYNDIGTATTAISKEKQEQQENEGR